MTGPVHGCESDAEAFGRRNAVPGELLVRLCPDKIIAIDDLLGE